jgi:hypothetical protein
MMIRKMTTKSPTATTHYDDGDYDVNVAFGFMMMMMMIWMMIDEDDK